VLSRLHLKTEKARRTLHEFVVQAWPLLESATPFVEGMHVRAVCEHLQAVAEGRLRHLIINIPPGHAKSLLTAVFWPAWVWIDHPEASSSKDAATCVQQGSSRSFAVCSPLGGPGQACSFPCPKEFTFWNMVLSGASS
jgi:hypothetical protein